MFLALDSTANCHQLGYLWNVHVGGMPEVQCTTATVACMPMVLASAIESMATCMNESEYGREITTDERRRRAAHSISAGEQQAWKTGSVCSA